MSKIIFQLKDFKANYEFLGSTKGLDRAIEKTTINVHWMKNHYKIVQKWLESRKEEEDKKKAERRKNKDMVQE